VSLNDGQSAGSPFRKSPRIAVDVAKPVFRQVGGAQPAGYTVGAGAVDDDLGIEWQCRQMVEECVEAVTEYWSFAEDQSLVDEFWA
jgi:hypothetical protein